MEKRTPIGAFIHSSWINLNIRAGKYKHLQTVNKCKTYKDVLISFTREEYKELCILNKESILNLKKPSLDRIDKNLGYDLSNVQFIELADNIRKDKTSFKNGSGKCSICKEIKLQELFTKDNRRAVGRSSICKMCHNKRRRLVN
tara:strand:+ start:87 stop:518 length:432 start_codon:yes stop_codon:yes gene_type:complete